MIIIKTHYGYNPDILDVCQLSRISGYLRWQYRGDLRSLVEDPSIPILDVGVRRFIYDYYGPYIQFKTDDLANLKWAT